MSAQTAERPVETLAETGSPGTLAHRYCWHCEQHETGAPAFCGNLWDGVWRPRGEHCVVCAELEPLGCPKCGAS